MLVIDQYPNSIEYIKNSSRDIKLAAANNDINSIMNMDISDIINEISSQINI